jgi:hypothetical protein
MSTIRIALLISGVAILLSVASQRVEAAGNEFTSTFSGTFVTTALDLDADSCTGTPPVCTDLSYPDTISGWTSGRRIGFAQFNGQSVVELVPVPGTGCAFAPTAIKSCTLGAVANACEFQSVGVGTKADRYSTDDILTGIIPSGAETLCFDSSTGNHAGSVSGSITGGSGKFAGVTGTFKESFHGKTLSSDPQGHGFGWFQAELTGTVIEP